MKTRALLLCHAPIQHLLCGGGAPRTAWQNLCRKARSGHTDNDMRTMWLLVLRAPFTTVHTGCFVTRQYTFTIRSVFWRCSWPLALCNVWLLVFFFSRFLVCLDWGCIWSVCVVCVRAKQFAELCSFGMHSLKSEIKAKAYYNGDVYWLLLHSGYTHTHAPCPHKLSYNDACRLLLVNLCSKSCYAIQWIFLVVVFVARI